MERGGPFASRAQGTTANEGIQTTRAAHMQLVQEELARLAPGALVRNRIAANYSPLNYFVRVASGAPRLPSLKEGSAIRVPGRRS